MYVEQQIADSVNNSNGDMTYNSNNLYCIQLTRWPLAKEIKVFDSLNLYSINFKSRNETKLCVKCME